MSVKFGWCGPIEIAGDVRRAGLDYVEVQLVPMNLDDDAAFVRAKSAVAALAIPALAFSYLFPNDVRVVGTAIDEVRNRKYFDRVVEILRLAKAQIVVLGSGWTRNIPDGYDPRRAEAEFLATLSWCADALAGSGTTLVIEPLNRKESNFINCVADGVRFAKLLDRPEVRGLADFYHMDEEGEALSEVEEHCTWLGHVHLADTKRLNPGTGRYDYDSFFRHLKRGGYGDLMSAECGLAGEPAAAMKSSVEFLRRKWSSADGS